jgi:hypothetical protein
MWMEVTMRALSTCLALVLTCSATRADPDDERAKNQLKSDNYTVTWGTPPAYRPDAELEVGFGNGHGGWLVWARFRPGKDGVEVLSIKNEEEWPADGAKRPPDRDPVVVKHARLEPDAYAALLRDIAVVAAAELEPVERKEATRSTNDFWVSARLTAGGKTLLDLDWAGYDGSRAEVEYAKPGAVVLLAREAIKGIASEEHSLTAGERAWASGKFARDWKRFKGLRSHWWVVERSVITVGFVGDAAAFPALREVLGGDPEDRSVYHAINAVTRLTGKDVRDKPVERMDVEKTRRKVLDLIKDKK